MYKELIKSLRICSRCDFGQDCNGCTQKSDDAFCCDKLLHEAANAIEELQKAVNFHKFNSEFWEDKYISLIDEKWIPVTERLPKADEHDARGYAVPYLVMNGWMRVTARRTKDYWVLFGVGTVLEYVTHWMPLPEPPKEE